MLQAPQHKHILIMKIIENRVVVVDHKDWIFVTSTKLNNSTTEQDTMKLITSFHSESIVHSNDINISYSWKLSKIGENTLMTWHSVEI